MSTRAYQITLARDKFRAHFTGIILNVRQYQLVRNRATRSMHNLNDTNKWF